MEVNKLKGYLAEGLSLNKIAKKEGKSLSSIRYWVGVYGLKSDFKNFKEEPFRRLKLQGCKKNEKPCPRCKKSKSLEEYYSKGERKHSYCKVCLHEYQAERWRQRKKKAVELMGGKCSRCGYCRNYSALEFHHLDPTQKDFDFNVGRRRSWDKMLKELKKCVLLCSNCHKEEHHPETLLDGETSRANVILNLGPKITGKCLECKTNVFGTKYCSHTCAANSKRRADRPSREELEKLIETTPILQIGKKYKVSDNAIRKWADHYGLNHK